MISLPGYHILDTIYNAEDCEVVRATREPDGLRVVLKILAIDVPTPRDILRYRQENAILSALGDIPGVIRVHELVETGQRMALVLEDFDGTPLSELIGDGGVPLPKLLPLAIQAAAILGQIHDAGVIHKDINPSNILHNLDTGQVKIIDFGLSRMLNRENPALGHLHGLEGTLRYISPEQTGRMNRSLDYRTDLYSFGATLYELLLGEPMFVTQSVLELIHSHIARSPLPPHEVDPGIPRVVSDIVMKLLAKTPERRYQSAHGLKLDLETCQQLLAKKGQIPHFVIAQKDASDRLNIPQKLYGRQAEQSLLLEAFERMTLQGSREVVLISGKPGIGKTSLVQEIYRPMTQHRATYVAGKFELLQRNTPYFGLLAACMQLTRSLLSEQEEEIHRWRERVLAAVSPNGRVLTDFIPEFELLLGQQPEVPALGPTESENRFFHVFSKLIGALATREHPLILFLDDLQWADAASLKLLVKLLNSPEELCLFFIGAYRDNEVSEAHPLMLAVREFVLRCAVSQLRLEPLASEHIAELVGDTLHAPVKDVMPLVEQIMAKTQGNPFFVSEFLESLSTKKLLAYDVNVGAWRWDLERIRTHGFTENVVDLLAEKFARIDPSCQQALGAAACLGHKFHLDILALFLERTPKHTLKALYPAIRSGLIFPLGDAYCGVEHDTLGQHSLHQVEFRFAHDRIHTTAYAQLSEREKLEAHKKLGQTLLEYHPPTRSDAFLFEITNQLNAAIPLITLTEERLQLARLDLLAGIKAKSTVAYEQALRYLLSASGLLEPDGWEKEYALMLDIATEAAEAAFLCTDFERMVELADSVIAHAATPMEKLRPYQVKIWGQLALNNPVEGIRTALQVLGLLGMRFPEVPSTLQVVAALLGAKLQLKRRGARSLLDLPEMADQKVSAAIQIMRSMTAALFQANPKLHVLMMCKQLQLLFRYGNCAWSGSICASFGILFASLLDDLDSADQMGQLAMLLSERFPSAALKARTGYVYNCFEAHVRGSLSSTLKPLQEGYVLGLQTGDLEYAAFNAHIYCQHAFFQGMELAALEKEMRIYSERIQNLKQQKLLSYNQTLHQVLLNLLGRGETPWVLTGEVMNEPEYIVRMQEAKDLSGLAGLYLEKLQLALVFEQPQEALQNAEACRAVLPSVRGMFLFTRFFAYDSLARLACYSSASPAERKGLLRAVATNQRKLHKRAEYSAENHLHLYLFVEAERCRIKDDLLEAMRLYDQAIETASQNRFLNDLAMIQERAAEYYLRLGRAQISKSYLLEARASYLKWGAAGKVSHLEKKYEAFLVKDRPSSHKSVSTNKPAQQTLSASATMSTSLSSTTHQTSGSIDFESVIKATQTISGQIVLADLLDSLIRIAIENAGAEMGALVFENEGRLLIEAHFDLSKDDSVSVVAVPLESSKTVCANIIRYVFRTRDSVVLCDAANEGNFVQDNYVQEQRPKSVMCIPILRSKRVVGVLYLENNQAADVFSSERVAVLDVLSAQAAISLENARLYKRLEDALFKAQEAARIKTEFLATISHELRTPLNPIINFSEGMIEEFSRVEAAHCAECDNWFELDPGERIEEGSECSVCSRRGSLRQGPRDKCGADEEICLQNLRIIKDTSTHLLSLVEDLLESSSLELGKASLHAEEIPIGTLVEEVVLSLQSNADKNSVALVSSPVPAELRLVGDRVKLKQILSNLINNAIKFSPREGRIDIRAQSIDPEHIRLAVSDQGIGISKEHQAVIFEPFRQIDGSATRKFGGAGLGLAIVKRLAELHGGNVHVESEPGKGSTFFVDLPLRPGSSTDK